MNPRQRKRPLRLGALLLAGSLALVGFAGCGIRAQELTRQIQPQAVERAAIRDGFREGAMKLALAQLRAAEAENGSAVVSPASLLSVLAMAQAGAEGETRAEMEAALGLSTEALLESLAAYASAFPEREDVAVHAANSLWLAPDLSVEEAFLQTMADYFDAQVFCTDLTAASTVRDANRWVEEHTRGKIDRMLDEPLPEDARMLLGALSFDAEWQTPFSQGSVVPGTFHGTAGDQDAEFLLSQEEYFANERVSGFRKYYAGGDYSFVAFLPAEGLDVTQLLSTLTAEEYFSLLEQDSGRSADIALPKWEAQTQMDCGALLQSMGVQRAFTMLAQFGGMSPEPLYIGKIVQKATLTVDERGTSAGAATEIEMRDGAAFTERPEVRLDRPFVYAVVDNATQLPLFFGVAHGV